MRNRHSNQPYNWVISLAQRFSPVHLLKTQRDSGITYAVPAIQVVQELQVLVLHVEPI